MTEDQIKHMVDRFLSWRLPENFNPDCGISFDRSVLNAHTPHPSKYEPTGTNVLDADQATAMVRHMIEGLPSQPPSSDAVLRLNPWSPVGEGTPLNAWLETRREGENGTNECFCRIISIGDEPEWIDRQGYSTIINPSSFAAPTHWRWPAALSSAPSPAAGDVRKTVADAINRARYSFDHPYGPRGIDEEDRSSREYAFRLADAAIAALSSSAADSDGWQRDAALEEAARLAERECGQNAWKQHMPISDYIAKAIRALKSTAPTQADDGQTK